MRNRTMRTLTALLGLLLLAGTAAAQTSLDGACSAAGLDASAACGTRASATDGSYDLDASAATEHASGLAEAEAAHADADTAADGTLFGWLSLRWSLVVEKLNEVFGMAGQDAPDANGGVDVSASTDGVDLDATVGAASVDTSPIGDLDGQSIEATAQAHGANAQARTTLGGALG